MTLNTYHCPDAICYVFVAEQQPGNSAYSTATSGWHKEPFPTA
jgi:hypothetical protein